MYKIFSKRDDMFVTQYDKKDGTIGLSFDPLYFPTKKQVNSAVKRIIEEYGNRDNWKIVFERKSPVYKKFTYNQLMKDAQAMYNRIAVHSPFCAECDVRDYIASKIDSCVDANRNPKAKKVRTWDEYAKYAPMKRADYESRKKWIEENYKNSLVELEHEWKTRGKGNPDFHKI